MTKNIIFKKEYYIKGIFNVILIMLLLYILFLTIFDSQLLINLMTLIGVIAVLLIFHKKWFYSIEINFKKGVIINHFLSFKKDKYLIEYSKILKIDYKDYEAKSPSHILIHLKNEKIRCDCSKLEAKKIDNLIKAKDLFVNFMNDEKIANQKYRDGSIYKSGEDM